MNASTQRYVDGLRLPHRVYALAVMAWLLTGTGDEPDSDDYALHNDDAIEIRRTIARLES
jgi:hypothetical protein